MSELIDNIKNLKAIYVVFLVLGVFAAILSHVLNKKKYKNFVKVSIIYLIGIILACFFAFTIIEFFNFLIRRVNSDNDYYLTNFSFLITLIMFVLSVKLLCMIFDLDFNKMKEPFLASILFFLVFAKIGCFLNGCCLSRNFGGVVLHFNLYECILAVIFLILYYVLKKDIFYPFMFIYLFYRFVSEFFKDTYFGQRILFEIFTGTHIISFIALIILFIIFCKTMKKEKK